jgi:hypothetical protein
LPNNTGEVQSYGANISRVELDARKSGSSLSDATNPLDMPAEIFNNYEEFTPQHAMTPAVIAL